MNTNTNTNTATLADVIDAAIGGSATLDDVRTAATAANGNSRNAAVSRVLLSGASADLVNELTAVLTSVMADAAASSGRSRATADPDAVRVRRIAALHLAHLACESGDLVDRVDAAMADPDAATLAERDRILARVNNAPTGEKSTVARADLATLSGTKVTYNGKNGTVTDDGIKVSGKVYGTPTAAAHAANPGATGINGWLAWHLADGSTLDDALRQ